MPIPVRNCEAGPTVFSDTTKNVKIEWERAGDPNGNDIQIVADDVFEMTTFQRALRKGIFQQETDESLAEAAFDQQTAQYRNRESEASSAASLSIDQAPKNDIVQAECIGPNARGTGLCGTPVTVREGKRNEIPPLCDLHKKFAPEFIPSETGEVKDGKPVVKWTRSVMEPRETQQ